jgi:hypothetical protein
MATPNQTTQEQIKRLQEAQASLTRIQQFTASSLVQKEKLGQSSFEEAVEPAKRIIDLFKQLPATMLEQLPESELKSIRSSADSIFALFEEILAFDVDVGDVKNRQSQFVDRLKSSYQNYFTQLYPLISFSVARTVDFNRLEEQGRAAVQNVRDLTDSLMAEIADQQTEAARILEQVRQTAAERGVSQEAEYFKKEADIHRDEAEKWQTWTIWMSIVVGLYGFATLFLHKIPFLTPTNTYETIQLIASKLIIFFVLVYMLAISARNFLSNRHNEIVNRHRQNALMTYRTLVDAGGTAEARDVILNHAAASVYQLHDTGFTKSTESGSTTSSSVIGLLSKGSFSNSTSAS